MTKKLFQSSLAIVMAAFLTLAGMKSFVIVHAEGTSQNLLASHVTSKRGVVLYTDGTGVATSTRFSDAALAAVVDGDTSTAVDVYGALDWAPPRYVGAEFTLDDVYDISSVFTYSGFAALNDTIRVYASENLATLYNTASIVLDSIVNDGTQKGQSLASAVRAKYIAYVITNYNGNARVKEFQAYGRLSVSGLTTISGVTATGVWATGATSDTINFAGYTGIGTSQTTLDKLKDGNRTSNHADMYWNARNEATSYLGVLYDLKSSYDVTGIYEYAYSGTYASTGVQNLIVYAGNDLASLIQDGNKIYSNTTSTYDTPAYATNVGRNGKLFSNSVNARYVMFFFNSNTVDTSTTDNWCRVLELEIMVNKSSLGVAVDAVPTGSDVYIGGLKSTVAAGSTYIKAAAGQCIQVVNGTSNTVYFVGADGTAVKPASLQNAMDYVGTAIRTTGTQGLRFKSSITLSARGVPDGYTLKEYGTVISKESALAGKDLYLGATEYKTVVGKAYDAANNTDVIFENTGSTIHFTSVLVNISTANYNTKYASRAYAIYQSSTGETYTIYGNTVSRSIYEIAKLASSDTGYTQAEMDYFQSIIHSVEGI